MRSSNLSSPAWVWRSHLILLAFGRKRRVNGAPPVRGATKKTKQKQFGIKKCRMAYRYRCTVKWNIGNSHRYIPSPRGHASGPVDNPIQKNKLFMGPLSPFKECCSIKLIKQAQKGAEREGNASLNLYFEVIWCYGSSCVTYSTRVAKYFDLAEIWGGGREVSDATGYNSGYWFLGVTMSVSPSYNELLCAHNLPADRADSLVDMTDHCKSKNRDRLLRICQRWPPWRHPSWWYGRMTDWSRSSEPYSTHEKRLSTAALTGLTDLQVCRWATTLHKGI
jgi:hypothetical protein